MHLNFAAVADVTTISKVKNPRTQILHEDGPSQTCLSSEFVECLWVDVAGRHPGQGVHRGRVALAGHGVVVAHRLVVAAGLKDKTERRHSVKE